MIDQQVRPTTETYASIPPLPKAPSSELSPLIDPAWLSLFRYSPAALSTNALDGRFLSANPSFLKMSGYDLDQILSLSAPDITPIEDRADCLRHIQALIDGTADFFEIEKGMICRSGKVLTVRLSVSLVKDAQGVPLHLMALTEDVTEKKRAEEALRAKEERLSTIIQYTTVGVNLVDLAGNFIDVNPAFTRMLGYTYDECMKLNVASIVHPDFLEMTFNNIQALLSGQIDHVRTTKSMLKKDGSTIWTEVTVSTTKDSEGKPASMVAIVQDITQRLETEKGLLQSRELVRSGEEKLRLAEERMRLATDAANMGIWDFNPEIDRIEQTRRANEILGYPADFEPCYKDITDRLHPADRERFLAAQQYYFDPAFEAEHGGSYQFVGRFLTPKNELRWLHIHGQIFFDARNDERKAVRAIGAVLDVTEQSKLAEELKSARDSAEIANATKSAFLANMSHEIRTPLSAIVGYSSLLLSKQGTDSDRQGFLNTVIRNGRMLMHLIDDILDLSKVEAGRLEMEKVPVIFSELIGEVMSVFHHKTKEKGISLILNQDPDVPAFILSDPTRLRQILMNVIGNAVKFTDIGSINVRVSTMRSEESPFDISLAVAVSDTGIGLNEEQQQRLFQPFSQADNSTTRKFGGTGLGLHLAKRLAHALSGDLYLQESTFGQGSTFVFRFRPESVTPIEGSPSSESKREASIDLAGRLILVAEDSPDIQFLIVNLLESQGADVVTANNGQEALDCIHRHAIDLVLMDIQMPVMDGYEATGRLRELGFRRPILALTAHAMTDEKTRSKQAGCDIHLTKPLNPRELFQAFEDLGVGRVRS